MRKKSIRGRLDGSPNPVDVFVGNRVRIYRTLKGFSQEALGAALGLTFQQIQKYEKGQNRIGASRLWDISQTLQVPVAYFYEGISEKTKSLSPRNIQKGATKALIRKAQEEKESLLENPLNRKETLELVRAYYNIGDRNLAHKLYELIRSLADSNSENDSFLMEE